MQIIAKCPKCDAGLAVSATDPATAIKCGACSREIPLTMSEALRADQSVDRCPVCSGQEFYIRKDFDPKIGLTVVIIGALVSAVFYWFERDFIAYGILGGAALIDLFVYGRLKFVTVCYCCHSEFRGAYAKSAAAFDLHTADVLEMEYERKKTRGRVGQVGGRAGKHGSPQKQPRSTRRARRVCVAGRPTRPAARGVRSTSGNHERTTGFGAPFERATASGGLDAAALRTLRSLR
jgi:hypothetical protein